MSDDHFGPSDRPADLPPPVAAFVRAINTGEQEALLETFAERALVNDELREYWDRPAIDGWAAHVVRDQGLKIAPRGIVLNGDHLALRVTADGAFDKRGLPDPLLLSLYFSLRHDKIVQLIIMRNEPAIDVEQGPSA